MLTATDELAHLASTLAEPQAEQVLRLLHERLPRLFGEEPMVNLATADAPLPEDE